MSKSIGTRREKLLFLCQTLPYPPDGGVNIRSYHLLRLLAQKYEVTALCFFRRASRSPQAVESGVKALGEFARVEAFQIPQEHSRTRWVWDHLRSVLFRRAYTVFAYQSREMEERLSELLSTESFAFVHIDSLDLAHYVPMSSGRTIICGHHNVESVLLSRRAEVQTSWFRRTYMNLQAQLTRNEERALAVEVDWNITCSEEDAILLREISPRCRATCIPNGVDTQAFRPSSVRETDNTGPGVVFVGGYTWFPNRDGMEWFAKDILPLLRENVPDAVVTWVGRMPEEIGHQFQRDHGVAVTGYVDDIRPYVHNAACFIVPIRVGGGTRLKILDAWAMEKAIVSTTVGCEGLRASPGENLLIADTPEEFAHAVKAVLQDRSLQHRLARSGRKTVEHYYDWEFIGRTLHQVFDASRDPALPTTNLDSNRRS